MATKKKIVEKGSYEKNKVETYPSKKAMVKHEKKETKTFEKGEATKPSPMKQVASKKTTSTPRSMSIAVKPKGGIVSQTPVMQKKTPAKMKKC